MEPEAKQISMLSVVNKLFFSIELWIIVFSFFRQQCDKVKREPYMPIAGI